VRRRARFPLACLLACFLPFWLCRRAVVPTLLAVCCCSAQRRPIHSSCERPFSPFALSCLYLSLLIYIYIYLSSQRSSSQERDSYSLSGCMPFIICASSTVRCSPESARSLLDLVPLALFVLSCLGDCSSESALGFGSRSVQ